MRSYEARSTIAAAPMPSVDAVDGRIAPGGKVTIRSTAAPGRAFRVREEYTGPLLGLIWRSMPDLGPSLHQFADGLEHRVEAGR